MKLLLRLSLIVVLAFSGVQTASAHGGGLDWQGGHNCRVGSCAGTYHCHQARGGSCAQSSSVPTTVPKVTKPNTSKSVAQSCVANSVTKLTKSHIAMIQARLKDLGYQPGVIDGVLGSQTVQSLNSFESDYDLSQSSRNYIHPDTIFTLGARCD